MLIQQIMEVDKPSCYQAMEKDQQLKLMEDSFYMILSECSENVSFDMERTVNAYMSRVTRIAYLQGMKDFAEMFVVLREDIHEILQKYVEG